MNPFYEGMVKAASPGRPSLLPHLPSGDDSLHEDNQAAHGKWKEAHEEIGRQLQEASGPEAEYLQHLHEIAGARVEEHGALHAVLDHAASGRSLDEVPTRLRNLAAFGLKNLKRG